MIILPFNCQKIYIFLWEKNRNNKVDTSAKFGIANSNGLSFTTQVMID